ncbi:hypothetical protein C8A05DRAFT_40175, partial [Staphylotrichum tortipilum]
MPERRHCSGYEIVARVDTWPYYDDDPAAYREFMRDYFAFAIEGIPRPIGLIHRDVVDALPLRVWQHERFPVYSAAGDR